MNRKQRRQTAKRLGIMDYQRKLPIEKRFDLIRENIIVGSQIHEEFVRKTKLSQEELQAEQEAQIIYERASKIASNEKISFVDAIEKAKVQIYEENKHLLEK